MRPKINGYVDMMIILWMSTNIDLAKTREQKSQSSNLLNITLSRFYSLSLNSKITSLISFLFLLQSTVSGRVFSRRRVLFHCASHAAHCISQMLTSWIWSSVSSCWWSLEIVWAAKLGLELWFIGLFLLFRTRNQFLL